MPPLANITRHTVTATRIRGDGTPSTGVIYFRPSVRLVYPATNEVVVPRVQIPAPLVAGSMSIALPATDDPDLEPSGWVWEVAEHVDGEQRRYFMPLTADVDLATVAPVDPIDPQAVYAPVSTALSASALAEIIRDRIGATLAAGANVTVTVDDNGDTVTIGLTGVATSAQLATETTDRQNADALLIPLAQKGVANGVATLGADAKIPSAQIPALALSEFLGAVASEAAMLALVGQRGDWAIRTDLNPNRVFILESDDPTQVANWTDITTAGAVQSVNGQTGAVALDAGDVPFDPTGLDVVTATDTQTAVEQVDTHLGTLVRKAGDTMTGALTLSGNAASALHATPLQQVQALIAALVDSSPAALDTLNELAAALGDDANFATTVTTALATKETPAGAQAKVDTEAAARAAADALLVPKTDAQAGTTGKRILTVTHDNPNAGPLLFDLDQHTFEGSLDPIFFGPAFNMLPGGTLVDPALHGGGFGVEAYFRSGAQRIFEAYFQVIRPDLTYRRLWHGMYDLVTDRATEMRFEADTLNLLDSDQAQRWKVAKVGSATFMVLYAPNATTDHVGLILTAGGVQKWQFYRAAGSDICYLRDLVNSRMHVTYTPGASADTAITDINSGLTVQGPMPTGFVRKTADEAVNSAGTGTTLQNDNHLLSALVANATYRFKAVLFTTGPGAGDMKLAFTVPAGASCRYGIGGSFSPGGSGNAPAVDAPNTLTHGTVTTTSMTQAVLEGIVRTAGTAGNLQLQWAQNTADASDTSVLTDSYLDVQRVA